MKVVILCGGDSLRFKNASITSSKVMAPIGGKPLVEHIMAHYTSFGFNEFILCVKDNDKEISAYFEKHDSINAVQVVKTGNQTPTGGRLKKIQSLINGEIFMVTYGDGISDVDLNLLVKFHNNHSKMASLTAVQPYHQFGILELGKDQKVLNFVEKPRMKEWINGGYFVFNRKVFSLLGENDILETDLLHKLAKQNELCAFYHKGFWKSMDTYKDYEDLNAKLL